METQIAQLRKNRVFHHFYQICQIPHESGKEKAISDYILAWAKNLGLEAEQDQVNNVLIRKPASLGYEAAPAVMLQAHIDMVCEKAEGVDHDFSKDPIDWVIEGDLLSTGGKTTLGADNGVGVALAMTVLESADLQHPELEVLFTVSEEDDFCGAENFDTSKMHASYLINLDHAWDTQIICGSCGGMQVDFRMPVQSEPTPSGWSAYRLSVSGLKGGHSGEDIHRGRGNANIMLTRLLIAAEQCCDYRLAQIKGGSFRLAIPREGSAVICLDPVYEVALTAKLQKLEQDMRAELSATADSLTVTLEPVAAVDHCTAPAPVIAALTLIPDGIYQMNELLLGLVDTSDNLGEVYLNEKELHMVLEIRSARESLGVYLFQRMERLANLLGGSCQSCGVYPSWEFHPTSKLRQLCEQVYQAHYGDKPSILTLHSGLEVGYFFRSRPQLDAIAIGPNCWNFHSPSEAVSISSVEKIHEYLINILSAIHAGE